MCHLSTRGLLTSRLAWAEDVQCYRAEGPCVGVDCPLDKQSWSFCMGDSFPTQLRHIPDNKGVVGGRLRLWPHFTNGVEWKDHMWQGAILTFIKPLIHRTSQLTASCCSRMQMYCCCWRWISINGVIMVGNIIILKLGESLFLYMIAQSSFPVFILKERYVSR
jgi:hypothetical protein